MQLIETTQLVREYDSMRLQHAQKQLQKCELQLADAQVKMKQWVKIMDVAQRVVEKYYPSTVKALGEQRDDDAQCSLLNLF